MQIYVKLNGVRLVASNSAFMDCFSNLARVRIENAGNEESERRFVRGRCRGGQHGQDQDLNLISEKRSD